MKNTQNTQNQNTTQQDEFTNTNNMLVSRKAIAWISYNYKLSLKTIMPSLELFKHRGLKQIIFETPLAWRYEEKFYIAVDLYKYLVIEIEDNAPVVKEIVSTQTESQDYNVIDKMFSHYQLKNKEENAVSAVEMMEEENLQAYKNMLAENLWKAVNNQISIALIQRIFTIGFSRAARMIDYLEEKGYIAKGPDNKYKAILCEREDFVSAVKEAYDASGEKQ